MVEIRGMQSEERETVHLMLDRAFPNTPKSFFDRQVKHDPVLRPEDTRVLLEDGIIRSCVRVYFRTIYCEGETLKMGGIGDVGTDPSVQGKGHATHLMNEALEYMKKRESVLSFLFTEINPFYEKVGYFTLPTLEIRLQPPPTKPIEYRRANMNHDLTPLRKIYDHLNSQRVGPVVRDKKYWKSQSGFPRLDPDLFWIVEENGKVICYARGFIKDDTLKIMELGHRPGEEENLRSLIATMAHSVQKKTVHISYLSQREMDLFTPWSSDIKENTALMVRLLQLDRFSSFRKLFSPHRILFWEADRF